MMSIAQRNAETVKQNQSEAKMNVDMRDINVTVVPPDMLILVSMNKLRQMTNELEAARTLREGLERANHVYLPEDCEICKVIKKYDAIISSKKVR